MQTQARNDSYLSWEVFWLGGCSIAVCFAFWAFTDRGASTVTISQLAFSLAFAINHPHFLSSYALLYKDFRKNILKKPRYFWAAVVAPTLLASFLVYAFANARADWMGYSLNLMFFLVGWHYVKQVFGCMIVTNARRKVYFTAAERRILLGNLFSLWALSFIKGQAGGSSFTFYGIIYPALGVPTAILPYSYALVAGSSILLLSMFLRKYVEQGVKPSPAGMAALGSLYVWYLPTFAHPAFAYLIPFFHSMQYLAFVWSFKSNQVQASLKNLGDRAQRAAWVKRFLGFALSVTVLGAMAFEFVPKFLDSQHLFGNPLFGTSPILAAFLLFINVHHYFIDNVIWRSDNEQVKQYLFASSTETSERSAQGLTLVQTKPAA